MSSTSTSSNPLSESRLEKPPLKPFLAVSAAWALVGIFCCILFVGEGLERAIFWLLCLWFLSILNLFFLHQLVTRLGEQMQGGSPLGVMVYGFLKLACLGFIVYIVIQNRSLPMISLLMGLGSLIVVPLLGGFWISTFDRSQSYA